MKLGKGYSLVLSPVHGEHVISQRKNSPRKSWIGSYFFTVRANKFAQWKMGFYTYKRFSS